LTRTKTCFFSIARFRELRGAYPSRITVVGHAFKHRRFEQLHRLALRWPKTRFAYEGLPLRNDVDEREAAAGELANAYTPYTRDLLRMPRAPGPKARGAEFSHSDSRLSRWCAGIARAVGVVPQG